MESKNYKIFGYNFFVAYIARHYVSAMLGRNLLKNWYLRSFSMNQARGERPELDQLIDKVGWIVIVLGLKKIYG